jgi:hypothetical protein
MHSLLGVPMVLRISADQLSEQSWRKTHPLKRLRGD